MPSPPWEPEALRLVETMLRYYTAHALSAEILSQDPVKRDRLANELKESKEPNVRHELVYDPTDDVPALLQNWDKALAQEPQTFEDHFFRIQYAISAALYYDRDVVSVAFRTHGVLFESFFQTTLALRLLLVDGIMEQRAKQTHWGGGAQLHHNGAALANGKAHHHKPEPPSSAILNLDLASAKALVAVPETLLSLQFYERGPDGGYWKVQSSLQQQTLNGKTVSFMVKFMDIDTDLELSEDALLDLMVVSCLCQAC